VSAPAADTPALPATLHGPAPRDLGTVAGFRVWSAAGDTAQVRFVGRGPNLPFGEVLTAITDQPELTAARMYQTHSADVAAVDSPGLHRQGDALYTRRGGLAVAVVTADCVPVLIEAGEWVAAIHAGWRGLVAGVIPAALGRLAAEEGSGDPGGWRAWIGPVNGACCYEVGWDVAQQVAEATSREAVVEHPGGGGGGSGERPFLDLTVAARHQLSAADVPVSWLVRCTQCDSAGLYSYRRSGQRAGRNLAFIWKE